MKIKHRSVLAFACTAAMTVNGLAGVLPQDRQEKKQEIQKTVTINGENKVITVVSSGGEQGTFNVRVPEPGAVGAYTVVGSPQQGGDSTFTFFSQEMSFDLRQVKDAPYSADTVSETVQTLADGNRIVQRSTGRAYRDGQGRTRTEKAFRMGGSNSEQQTITIYDPSTGENVVLDPEKKIARKSKMFVRVSGQPLAGGGQSMTATITAASPSSNEAAPKKINVSGGVLQGTALKRVQPTYPPVAKAAGADGAVQVQVTVSETGDVVEASAISGHPLLRESALEAARQWQFKPTELAGKPVKVQGILTFNFTLANKPATAQPTEGAKVAAGVKFNSNVEKLGTQMIEGLSCEGTRITTTLPAGAIGNENPINTVQEMWFSTELKMTVLSKRTDPRFGETTYRVTGINRAEPDAGLFTIPSDYTIQETAGNTMFLNFQGDGKTFTGESGAGNVFIRRQQQ